MESLLKKALKWNFVSANKQDDSSASEHSSKAAQEASSLTKKEEIVPWLSHYKNSAPREYLPLLDDEGNGTRLLKSPPPLILRNSKLHELTAEESAACAYSASRQCSISNPALVVPAKATWASYYKPIQEDAVRPCSTLGPDTALNQLPEGVVPVMNSTMSKYLGIGSEEQNVTYSLEKALREPEPSVLPPMYLQPRKICREDSHRGKLPVVSTVPWSFSEVKVEEHISSSKLCVSNDPQELVIEGFNTIQKEFPFGIDQKTLKGDLNGSNGSRSEQKTYTDHGQIKFGGNIEVGYDTFADGSVTEIDSDRLKDVSNTSLSENEEIRSTAFPPQPVDFDLYDLGGITKNERNKAVLRVDAIKRKCKEQRSFVTVAKPCKAAVKYIAKSGTHSLVCTGEAKAGDVVYTDSIVVHCKPTIDDAWRAFSRLEPASLNKLSGCLSSQNDLSEDEQARIKSFCSHGIRQPLCELFGWFYAVLKQKGHGMEWPPNEVAVLNKAVRASHSCTPNCVYRVIGRSTICYIATRNITKYEELTLSYTPSLFADSGCSESVLASCCSPSCSSAKCTLLYSKRNFPCPKCVKVAASEDEQSASNGSERKGKCKLSTENSKEAAIQCSKITASECSKLDWTDTVMGDGCSMQSTVTVNAHPKDFTSVSGSLDGETTLTSYLEGKEGPNKSSNLDTDFAEALQSELNSTSDQCRDTEADSNAAYETHLGSEENSSYTNKRVSTFTNVASNGQSLRCRAVCYWSGGSTWTCSECGALFHGNDMPIQQEKHLTDQFHKLKAKSTYTNEEAISKKLASLLGQTISALGTDHWLFYAFHLLSAKICLMQLPGDWISAEAFEKALFHLTVFYGYAKEQSEATIYTDFLPVFVSLLRVTLFSGNWSLFLKLADNGHLEKLRQCYGYWHELYAAFHNAYQYIQQVTLNDEQPSLSVLCELAALSQCESEREAYEQYVEAEKEKREAEKKAKKETDSRKNSSFEKATSPVLFDLSNVRFENAHISKQPKDVTKNHPSSLINRYMFPQDAALPGGCFTVARLAQCEGEQLAVQALEEEQQRQQKVAVTKEPYLKGEQCYTLPLIQLTDPVKEGFVPLPGPGGYCNPWAGNNRPGASISIDFLNHSSDGKFPPLPFFNSFFYVDHSARRYHKRGDPTIITMRTPEDPPDTYALMEAQAKYLKQERAEEEQTVLDAFRLQEAIGAEKARQLCIESAKRAQVDEAPEPSPLHIAHQIADGTALLHSDAPFWKSSNINNHMQNGSTRPRASSLYEDFSSEVSEIGRTESFRSLTVEGTVELSTASISDEVAATDELDKCENEERNEDAVNAYMKRTQEKLSKQLNQIPPPHQSLLKARKFATPHSHYKNAAALPDLKLVAHSMRKRIFSATPGKLYEV